MGYAGGGVNGTLRWKDLALDILLPVDKEKEEAEKAAHARKMASGATTNQYQPASQQPEATGEGDGDDENENDENDDDEMPEEREGETSYEDEDD